MSNPRTETAYRTWWRATELPMLQADYPDMDEEELDGWWFLKRDALVEDKRLPRAAHAWGRKPGATRCACGHSRDDHLGRTGAGACAECGHCQRFAVADT